jgi:hypothetical protein
MMDLLEEQEIEEVQGGLARAAIVLLEMGPRLDAFNEMAELLSSAEFVARTGNLRASAGGENWLEIGRAAAQFRDFFAQGYRDAKREA